MRATKRRWLACLLGSLALGCSGAPPPVAVFSEHDARTVLEPVRFGWLSSERDTGALPSAIALGAKSSGHMLVYLEFAEVEVAGRLLRAELVLSPTAAAFGRVPIELSRAEAARRELRKWSDQPKALKPRIAAHVTAQAWPQRLDVTAIVRAQARKEPLRLLLRAEPGEGEGVLIATGASGGEAPRLVIYWQ
jgi:hypothetical protein